MSTSVDPFNVLLIDATTGQPTLPAGLPNTVTPQPSALSSAKYRDESDDLAWTYALRKIVKNRGGLAPAMAMLLCTLAEGWRIGFAFHQLHRLRENAAADFTDLIGSTHRLPFLRERRGCSDSLIFRFEYAPRVMTLDVGSHVLAIERR